MSAEQATSLRRGLAILLALESGDELGVTRIAEAVGRDKSQVSRSLKVLADLGFVERDSESRGYRLGWKLFALAAGAGERRLAAAAPGQLQELVRTCEEGAHLSVLQDEGVLTVLSEAPPHALRAVSSVGRVVPAGCTSAGYALLVDHDRRDIGRFLPGSAFRRSHPRAPQSADELWERLVATRARGWALAEEDFEAGLVSVAAPVRDFRGAIIAAVNVSAPTFRLSARHEEAGRRVSAAADALSRMLGAQPSDGSMLAGCPSSSSSPSATGT